MDRSKGTMRHTAVGLNQDIGLTWMIQLNMVGSWTNMARGVITVGSILVLVQRDNIVITVTIYIGGVRSITFTGVQERKSPYI